jgi:hypothetical protein
LGRKSGSYKFEKRQKELKKQKKKKDKLERRLNKGGESDDEPQPSTWAGELLGSETEADNESDEDEFDDEESETEESETGD